MTETLPNSFTPTQPPVSPSTAPRPRKAKAKAPKAAKQPKVPKNLHAVTDAEIAAGAKKKKAKVEKAAPETVKVSLKEYASMRCGESAKLFLKAHKLLSGATAGARRSVLAELTKMLG